MPRISYVNGQYIRHAMAGVHIEDRGYQFADGVYEVVLIVNGNIVDESLHFRRLNAPSAKFAWRCLLDRDI